MVPVYGSPPSQSLLFQAYSRGRPGANDSYPVVLPSDTIGLPEPDLHTAALRDHGKNPAWRIPMMAVSRASSLFRCGGRHAKSIPSGTM